MEDAVEVYFPSVHDEHAGELVKLTCLASHHLKGIAKAVNGMEDQAVQHIIGASRYGEKGSTVGTGIIVSVSTPYFSGRSYGLALALADKMLRLGRTAGGGRVIATGIIEPDGRGRIDGVDQLTAKLRLIADNLRAGDSIWFPKDSLNPRNKEQQPLLRTIENKGGSYHAIEQVNDAQGAIWGAVAKTTPDRPTPVHHGKQDQTLLLGGLALLLVAMAVAWMHNNRTSRQTPPSFSGTRPPQQTAAAAPAKHEESAAITEPMNQEAAAARQITPQVSPPVTTARVSEPVNNKWRIQSVDVPTTDY